MKKEIGKWFLDIAKYVFTAGVISTLFGDTNDKWIVYASGMFSVFIFFGLGLYFIRNNK